MSYKICMMLGGFFLCAGSVADLKCVPFSVLKVGGFSVAALGSGIPLLRSSQNKIKTLTEELRKDDTEHMRATRLKKQLRKWKSLRALAIALISIAPVGGFCAVTSAPLVVLDQQKLGLDGVPAYTGPYVIASALSYLATGKRIRG